MNERLKLRKTERGTWVEPDQPDEDYIEMMACVIAHDLKPHLPRCVPITFEQFIRKYSGAKRMRYENAWKHWKQHSQIDKRDTKIGAFIKKELMLLKETKPFDDMISRIVQARTPKFNLLFGIYIRPCEDRVYHSIDKMFILRTTATRKEKTIMKGLNALEQGAQIADKWYRIGDGCCFIGLDASRFDQCCNKELLKILHEVIAYCFPNKADREIVVEMCALTLNNRCQGKAKDGIVEYLMSGGLCSGEMITAMTGCVIMSCVIFIFCVYHMKLDDFAAIDMGDDGGLFIDKKYIKAIQRELPIFFRQFGLVMTVEEPVFRIEHVLFCNTQPVWDGEKWRMVRDPRTASVKDATSLTPFNAKKDLANYLNSVGKGGLSLTGGIPMWQNYYRSMIKNGSLQIGNFKFRDIKLEGGLYYLSLRMSEKFVDNICDDARLSFYRAFGIIPDMQIAQEIRYDETVVEWCNDRCNTHSERACFTPANL